MTFRKALAIALLSWVFMPTWCLAEPPSLTVKINGALPATGNVEVSVFNSAETFMKTTYLQRSGKVSEDGSWSTEFASLEEGEYAVVVVHDANENRRLDNGLFGFGGERYGLSNNAWALFGRPDFDDAKISVTGPVEITIDLD
jgi:uncharacterized protein (DUF2141 family)